VIAPAAVEALAERLAAAGAITLGDALAAKLTGEAVRSPVVLPDRALLVHFRSDAVTDVIVALGTMDRPINRTDSSSAANGAAAADSVEGGDERIVVLLLSHPRRAAAHLQLLGALIKFVDDPDRVAALLAARTPDELAELPELREHAVATQLRVRDLMSVRPRQVGPDTPVRDAALAMVRAGIGGLAVVDDDGRVIGMLSERDLMRHLLTSYLHDGVTGRPSAPRSQRAIVRDVMTRAVLCVSPDHPLAEVASIMTNRDVDRVPVVEAGVLTGFLTRGDIVRKLIGS